jgi:transcriptional regulator GlxA family with amidase domain
LLDQVFDTGFTAVLDVLTLANSMGGSPFDVHVMGVNQTIRTGLGLQIAVEPLAAKPRPDWVIVPALAVGSPERILAALARADVKQAQDQVVAWRAKGTRVAAACIATYLIAEAGLLDDLEATTTWWLAPFFRQRYPRVLLDETRMLVPSEIGVTAGAAMGHLDLALWMVRQVSPELAAKVGRYLLVDQRSSQAPYIIPSQLALADPLIQKFERWARGRLAKGFSLQDAAKSLATSPRTLQRRCTDVLGKSPLDFFQDLRVERARTLIQRGDDIDAVAAQVGYDDGATLRSLLRQRLGRGVRDLRRDL